MGDTTIDIERVVQEVLRELKLQAVPPATAAPTHAAPTPETPPAPVPASDGQVTLSERLVTMSVLEGRLAGLRKLVVGPRSVVTPAVRDELARRNVQLLVGTDRATPDVAKESLRLVLVTHGHRYDPANLLAAMRKGSLAVEHQAKDCIMATSDLLAAEVAKPDTLGAVLTRHTAAGLCVANRLPGVRAVWGLDPAQVTSVAAAVGANLLVVDPAGGSLFWLKRMLDAFCAGGVRDCPEVFRKRLA
jgi:hypothetical protein